MPSCAASIFSNRMKHVKVSKKRHELIDVKYCIIIIY